MIARNTTEDLPPFPSDVPTAPIARISLAKILEQDEGASEAVIEACLTHGFFYLDLTSTDMGEDLLDEADDLHKLSHQVFALPLEEKTRYAFERGGNLFGYKASGSAKRTDPDQRPDTTEFFNVAKDHMFGFAPSRTYPKEILAQKELIKAFEKNAHEVGMIVIEVLAKQLGIIPSELTGKHLFSEPSGAHVRMTCKTPQAADSNTIGLASHTDFGGVTILFNWLGGLQIQSRDPDTLGQWEYVKPLPGHCIINLGDAMVTFTNGLLKAAKHRVVPAPGEQNKVNRHSLVYFVRPADAVMMEPLDQFKDVPLEERVGGKFEPEGGKTLTAGEWMKQRAIQLGGKK